jgi:phosphonate transport system substrate-binding protein
MKALATVALAALTGLSPLHAQTTLRVTTIPEEAATEQVRKFGPLVKYLERTLGMKV